MRRPLFAAVLAATAAVPAVAVDKATVQPYVAALSRGQAPVDFVNARLRDHDLLIFDDTRHTAVDPWEFVASLVRDRTFQKNVKYIFLEIGPLNFQPALDAYLDAPTDDPTLLYPYFQNGSDMGWPYKTYFDLLRTVREVNQGLPAGEKLRVLATDMPSYWPLMKTRRDWELNMLSADARDYHLFRVIASTLDNFRGGKKGIFLTNTRHAYKGIRNGKGELYWNAGTFFHEQFPGKTYAVHFHHATLEFLKRDTTAAAKTREGLDNVTVRMSRREDGAWDCAHAALGYKPVALDITGNAFGRAPYVGNHMLDAKPGQTMADAYDAVIFLAPLESLRQTATVDIYTPELKRELVRRMQVMRTPEDIAALLARTKQPSLEAWVDASFKPRAETVDPVVKNLPPLACPAK